MFFNENMNYLKPRCSLMHLHQTDFLVEIIYLCDDGQQFLIHHWLKSHGTCMRVSETLHPCKTHHLSRLKFLHPSTPQPHPPPPRFFSFFIWRSPHFTWSVTHHQHYCSPQPLTLLSSCFLALKTNNLESGKPREVWSLVWDALT